MSESGDNWLELPRGPRPGDQIEVLIEGLTAKGQGRGKLCAYVGPQREQRTYRVEVRKAIPGDHLIATVEYNRRSTIRGRIEEMLTPSSLRAEPRCRHFGRREEPGRGCGGCTLQNMSYDQQLRLKRERIAGLLEAQGLVGVTVAPIIPQADPWYYRNKMEFTFAPAEDGLPALGLFATGYRRTVLPLAACHLQSVESARLVKAVGKWVRAQELVPYRPPLNAGLLRTLTVREGRRTGERMVELTTSADTLATRLGVETAAEDIALALTEKILALAAENEVAVTSLYWTQHRAVRGERTRMIHHHIAGRPVLRERLHLPRGEVLDFEIHPRAFFQTNTEQAEVLYTEVLDKAGLLGGKPCDCVLDLYCGTGTIALCAAPYARRVIGIELQPDAVENALQNARLNSIENAEFLCGDVGEVLETSALGDTGADLIIVDPPRSGLRPDALSLLTEMKANRLVYVSCNPESLARDLAELVGAGWQVDAIQPVDLFPQTFHIECVVALRKGE